jgi:dCMP deaminase
MTAKDQRKIEVNLNNRKPLKRPSWEEYFLNIALAVSARSHDGETHVGSVIVDENKRILSTGYNGFPPGAEDHILPNLRPDKYPFMVHAEMNAIVSSKQNLQSATMFSTHSPCRECAKAIITAGIKNVIFKNSYKNDDHEFVAKFLKSCGVKVSHFHGTET